MKKKIHINRLGYMTGMPKTAVCRVTVGIFYLVDAAKGINVYAGRLSHPFFDRESGETVRIADFSDFNTKGKYFIRSGYRRSDVFEISDTPYKNIRSDAAKGIFLNRCGFDFFSDAVMGRADSRYLRRECHTEAVAANDSRHIDVSGGWHNSGGYGKNVADTGLAVTDMIYALRLFSESFTENEKLVIEDECRWGIDWMLKMQDSDGGVFSRVYSDNDHGFPSPEDDPAEYYIDEKSCEAALRFTSVIALAANYFSLSDREYSQKLRRAAERSWITLLQTSEYSYYCSRQGSYSEDGEGSYRHESDFMWAMCEMYSLTGDESFAEMITKRYITSAFTGFGKSSCGGFAALSYLLSDRRKDRSVEAFIRKHITDRADRICIAVNQSGYRTARSAAEGYTYGSSFGILTDCMEFIAAYLISGEQKYLNGATEQFSYIFGKNPMGMCFMTGEGEEWCKSPCHKLSVSFENEPAIPGMIVSGANCERDDEYSRWHIEKGAPASKCYLDSEYSISTNEPAVHFTAPVIFISAFYDKVGRSALSGVKKAKAKA